MEQFTKAAGTTSGLAQCAGLEPAVIQLLFGRGLLILGQLAGRWMEQLPAGRNFEAVLRGAALPVSSAVERCVGWRTLLRESRVLGCFYSGELI